MDSETCIYFANEGRDMITGDEPLSVEIPVRVSLMVFHHLPGSIPHHVPAGAIHLALPNSKNPFCFSAFDYVL
jgi:hypothetical protein